MALSYQQAKTIRNKSFLGHFQDRMINNPNESTFASARKTVSEKTKARVMGVTQYMDPMFLARAFTLGHSVGSSIYGKVMGRSKKDIEYFTGRKAKSKSRDQLKSIGSLDGQIGENSSSLDVLWAIYHILVKQNEIRRTTAELKRNSEEMKDKKTDDRHQQILQAITYNPSEGTTSHLPVVAQQKAKHEKLEFKQPKDFSKFKMPKKVDVEDAMVKDTLLTKLFKIGAGVAAVGVIGLGAKSLLAKGIMRGESFGGDATAYNFKNKEGKFTGGKGATPYGKSVTQMTVGEVRDHQAKGELHAVGKWQMIGSTLSQAVKEGYAKDSDTFDEALQDKLFEFFIKNKRPEVGRYLAGDPNVSRNEAILGIAKEWASVGIPEDIKEKGLKKGQSYYEGNGVDHAYTSPEYIGELLDEYKTGSKTVPATIDDSVIGPSGVRLDQSSRENDELTELLGKQQAQSQTINNYNVNMQQGQTSTSREKVDDRSAYQRKSSAK